MVLRMTFVFFQFEFLVSTITLKPYSRTSSLPEGGGGGGNHVIIT